MENYLQPIADTQSQLLSFKISTQQLVQYFITKIKEHQHLNIFIEIFEQEALNRAKDIDLKIKNNQKLGSLFGVVVSIKDVFTYKNHYASAASKSLQNYNASYNATVIQKLLDHDAIIIGRVNCDEFAMGSATINSIYGPTPNPHDTSRISGGSSGGCAASIAAKLCMISIGSDTGGSVRQPADFCGIFGFKPSYGKISRYGLIAYASSLDTVGILAHNIQDIQTTLLAISGQDAFDSTTINYTQPQTPPQINNLKIGYFKEMANADFDPQIKHNFQNTIQHFQTQHHITPIDFPFLQYLVPTYYIISCAEASSNLSRFDGIRYGHVHSTTEKNLKQFYKKNRSNSFGDEVKRRIMMGNFVLSAGYYDAYYNKAQQIRTFLTTKINDLFEQVDIIIMPTSPCLPWKIQDQQNLSPQDIYLADMFSVLANLTTCPAISIPTTKTPSGLPIGIQFLAKKGNDISLLQISQDFTKNFSSPS